jgi:hypothetical protein
MVLHITKSETGGIKINPGSLPDSKSPYGLPSKEFQLAGKQALFLDACFGNNKYAQVVLI